MLATVTCAHVDYRFGSHYALRGLDATWRSGVQGVLGPNGAGKTTLLRILAGIAGPSQGEFQAFGETVDGWRKRSQYRSQVGYLPQSPQWPGEFTVTELVTYFATLRRGWNRDSIADSVDRAIDLTGLTGLRDHQLRRLSGGERQRAFLAQSIVHSPKVLVLDEPTVGLDPGQRISLRRYIAEIGRDRLVFLSTHLVDDVMQVCSDIAVLNRGALIWSGTPIELENRGSQSRLSASLRSDPDEMYRVAASEAEWGFLSLVDDNLASGNEK